MFSTIPICGIPFVAPKFSKEEGKKIVIEKEGGEKEKIVGDKGKKRLKEGKRQEGSEGEPDCSDDDEPVGLPSWFN